MAVVSKMWILPFYLKDAMRFLVFEIHEVIPAQAPEKSPEGKEHIHIQERAYESTYISITGTYHKIEHCFSLLPLFIKIYSNFHLHCDLFPCFSLSTSVQSDALFHPPKT